MARRSSKPAGVTRAVVAPLRWRIAFVAMVVPWAMRDAPSSRRPSTTATDGAPVAASFAVTTAWPRNPTKSVKVPPTSTPTSTTLNLEMDSSHFRGSGRTRFPRLGRRREAAMMRIRGTRTSSKIKATGISRSATAKSSAMVAAWIEGLRRRAVLQSAREVLRVALHVEQPVAAVVERDHALLALRLRLEREVDHRTDAVGVLRRRDEALRLREDLPRLERAG